MKKNFLIILLAIISIASLGYGYQQKLRADEQRTLADLHARRAEQLRIQADHAHSRAQEALAEAARQRQLVGQTMLSGN